jgi:hypothetical protein
MNQVNPLRFFSKLRWLDGKPLVIEPYRQRVFEQALYTFDGDRPRYNLALVGRAKKNYKTADLILAALYRLLAWKSAAGNQCYILANDEDQAADDLELAKKLIAVNPILDAEVVIKQKLIERRDFNGFLEILPANDVAGSHGKTYLFCGFDEIHSYRNWDLFEALAMDPSRTDTLQWITSYASIFHRPGIPLFDLMASAKKADDPRIYFSWYASDFCTDADFENLAPELRANPSVASWNNAGYLAQQQKRLPSHKYRRLHLNLPGSPEGSAYNAERVMDAIERGVRVRPPQPELTYCGFVDMSGGSSDDACLGISHRDINNCVLLDRIVDQGQRAPFDPRRAVERFAAILKTYRCFTVVGDRYAGETFRCEFETNGISYIVSELTQSQLYEALEPRLNSGQVILLDESTLESQLLGLVWRANKIDHPGGEHDDWATPVLARCGSLRNSTTTPLARSKAMASASFQRRSAVVGWMNFDTPKNIKILLHFVFLKSLRFNLSYRKQIYVTLT